MSSKREPAPRPAYRFSRPPIALPSRPRPWRTESCKAGRSGSASPPTRKCPRRSSSTTSGRRRTRSPTSPSCWPRWRAWSRPEFVGDAEHGFHHAPMSVRVSPYLLSLIDWANPYEDPLRIQFIPLVSRLLPDHPKLDLDSLHERADMPVPGLTHRYPDKALFLPLDTCPVYCRFCTRSYAVGIDTEEVEKFQLKVDAERWRPPSPTSPRGPSSRTSSSRAATPTSCAPSRSRPRRSLLGHPDTCGACASRPRVRRSCRRRSLPTTRGSTRSRASSRQGRKPHKEVVLHTHFNHPNEITGSRKPRSTSCSSAASSCATRPCSARRQRLGRRRWACSSSAWPTSTSTPTTSTCTTW